MKQLKLAFFSTFLLVLFMACKRDGEKIVSNPIPETLSAVPAQALILSDTTFKALIKAHIAYQAKATNPDGIQQLMADDQITQSEYPLLANYHGYASTSELENYYLLLGQRTRYLNNRYNFRNLSRTDQYNIMKSGFDNEFAIERNLADFSCDSDFKSCLTAAAAQSLISHLACAGADLTLFGGILCHSAAFIIQFTKSNLCKSDYEKCIKQETPKTD